MRGAIFDLDGTLIATSNLHIKAWIEAFRPHHILLTKAELREQAGMKCTTFIKGVLKRRKISSLDPQAIANQKDQFVIEFLKKTPATVFPNVEDFLKLLKLNEIKIGLATSATEKTALMLGKKIIKYFDEKIFAEDVTIGKPDPQVFLKTAEKLKLNVKECIVFEDATIGVQAAKLGGFFCVAKKNALDQDLSKADLIIEEYHPEKLIKLFKN